LEKTICTKCGSTEILPDVPVVSNVDNLSAVPIAALTYAKPDALIFKGPITHRFLARVCGDCGFSEFYVKDPKGLMATAKQPVDDDD
jgi:predicted nucleic-acid-binding Zn-ribbon protein